MSPNEIESAWSSYDRGYHEGWADARESGPDDPTAMSLLDRWLRWYDYDGDLEGRDVPEGYYLSVETSRYLISKGLRK